MPSWKIENLILATSPGITDAPRNLRSMSQNETSKSPNPSPEKNPWLIAARPHTLPAAAAPVILGMALAYRDGLFSALAASFALAGALLIQIGTNFANDYFDAKKGVDTDERDGFTRVTVSGLIAPRTVWWAMVGSFSVALLSGIPLVYWGGIPILIIGLTGLLLGYAYAGGPIPFGSIGLGDLMVFLYFGIFAVCGTYYVQACRWLGGQFPTSIPAGTLHELVIISSIPPACLSTAILVVNNLRDLKNDRSAGKQTLATFIGYTGSRIEYTFLLAIAFGVPPWILYTENVSVWVLLPLASFPFSLKIIHTIWKHNRGKYLNPALTNTGRLLFLYCLLLSLGLIL